MAAGLHGVFDQRRLTGIDAVDVNLAERVSGDGEKTLRLDRRRRLPRLRRGGPARHRYTNRVLNPYRVDGVSGERGAGSSLFASQQQIRSRARGHHHETDQGGSSRPRLARFRGGKRRRWRTRDLRGCIGGGPGAGPSGASGLGGRGDRLFRPDGGGEVLHGGKALVGLLGQGPRDGDRERAGDTGPLGARERGLFVDVLVDDGMHRVAAERQLRGDHAVADHTQGVLVGAAIHKSVSITRPS